MGAYKRLLWSLAVSFTWYDESKKNEKNDKEIKRRVREGRRKGEGETEREEIDKDLFTGLNYTGIHSSALEGASVTFQFLGQPATININGTVIIS
jgi:hypothetical protein